MDNCKRIELSFFTFPCRLCVGFFPPSCVPDYHIRQPRCLEGSWWANPRQDSVFWCSRQAVNTLAYWRGRELERKRNNISFAQGLFLLNSLPLCSLPSRLGTLSQGWGNTRRGEEEANFSVRLFSASAMTDEFGASHNYFFLNPAGDHRVHRHNRK